jgi:hypothetical protein
MVMDWHGFDDGSSIGSAGSERGTIIRDEELSSGARITLERDGHTAPYAITCGVYGWMVHTRFFEAEAVAQLEFERMKAELAAIVDAVPVTVDPEAEDTRVVIQRIGEFVENFP